MANAVFVEAFRAAEAENKTFRDALKLRAERKADGVDEQIDRPKKEVAAK